MLYYTFVCGGNMAVKIRTRKYLSANTWKPAVILGSETFGDEAYKISKVGLPGLLVAANASDVVALGRPQA